MKFYYDKQSDALSIRFNDNPYAESDEVKEGVIFDYDQNNKIIGIEILDASKIMPGEFSKQNLVRNKRIPVIINQPSV